MSRGVERGATLVVTNDFGPRVGGIETFVEAMARRFDPARTVVHTAGQSGAEAFDRALPFRVVRDPARLLVPTPAVARRCAATARDLGCDRVWFGAAAPLALMAPVLRRAGVVRAVATTHSHEEWWSMVPGTRAALRAIGERVDTVTYLGEHSRARLARVLTPAARDRMRRLSPGVDLTLFSPAADGRGVRRRWGLGERPVAVCISRFVARKGQDTLIDAWPEVCRRVPGAVLLLVGDGPHRGALLRRARATGLLATGPLGGLAAGRGAIVFAGRVAHDDTPAYFAAGTVFAMPTRTRLGGLEPEGVPICFLEAQATGLPVVVGRSGGAPDTVADGVTGLLVDGRDAGAVGRAVAGLLADPARARAWGLAGRDRMAAGWQWDQLAGRLQRLLDPALPAGLVPDPGAVSGAGAA